MLYNLLHVSKNARALRLAKLSVSVAFRALLQRRDKDKRSRYVF